MKFKYHIDRAPQLRISLFVCSYVLRETSFFGNYKTIENAAHRCCLIAVASDEFHSDVFILIGLDSLKDSMDCAFIIVIRLIQLTLSRRLVLLNKCDQIMHWFIRTVFKTIFKRSENIRSFELFHEVSEFCVLFNFNRKFPARLTATR